VPLSEHEQRLLEQMERALYAEDPKFASSLRSSGSRPGVRRSAVTGVLAALVGVAALIAGAATSIVAIGVLGFVLMLVGTFLVIRALSAPAGDPATAAPAPGKPAPAKRSGFMDKAEERFRKRREGGEL
jgi:hypothetical protein